MLSIFVFVWGRRQKKVLRYVTTTLFFVLFCTSCVTFIIILSFNDI